MELDKRKAETDAGEIDVAGLIVGLWPYRFWILFCTLAITLVGGLHAFLSTPLFYAHSTIALKESGKGNEASRLFSQFGGMGGMVAAQLGLGNTNLNKVEIVLKGHDLAETVIRQNNLMPLLFPDLWNAKEGAWIPKDSAKVPTLRGGIEVLRRKFLSVTLDAKTNVIRLGVKFRDPTLAKQIVDFYLSALNDKIRSDVIRDAEVNREYLERQLGNTLDPVLREKIQTMIGMEIEKSMLVSTQAFEVLERPVVPIEIAEPKRKVAVMLAFLVGLFASLMGILAWKGAGRLRVAAAGRKLA